MTKLSFKSFTGEYTFTTNCQCILTMQIATTELTCWKAQGRMWPTAILSENTLLMRHVSRIHAKDQMPGATKRRPGLKSWWDPREEQGWKNHPVQQAHGPEQLRATGGQPVNNAQSHGTGSYGGSWLETGSWPGRIPQAHGYEAGFRFT